MEFASRESKFACMCYLHFPWKIYKFIQQGLKRELETSTIKAHLTATPAE
jgi:hypothetical protein